MKSTIVRWGLATLVVGAMAGCGGGGDGFVATPGTPGTPAASACTLSSADIANPANDSATNPNAAFTTVQGCPVVTVASPPKVNFTVIDQGEVVQNLTTSGNTGVRFAIAKLIPGTNGSPGQWANYIYRTRTATGGSLKGTTVNQATTDTPATDGSSLVYHPEGYYTYTFAADIKTAVDPADGKTLLWDPTATQRVAFQVQYVNKAGKTVYLNATYDFTVDGNGNSAVLTDPTKTLKIVDVSSCNECHDQLRVHGRRVQTNYCVMCHNSRTTDDATSNVVEFRRMVHKIHGGELLKTAFNEDYTVQSTDFAEMRFPQDLRNCTKCHSGSKKDAAGNQLAAQGDNWKIIPNRAACGSCHSGINFDTGKGLTLEDALAGKTTSQFGHVGGIQTDDSNCHLCHSAAAIPTYHIPATPPDPDDARFTGGTNTHSNSEWIDGNQNNLPAGAIKVTWDISSVSKNASKQPVIVFKGLQNGTAVPFNDPGAKTEIWDNFFGSPSLYFVFAVPQDGIAKPADFNASTSVYLKKLWNGTATTNSSGSSSAGTLTGPDSSGNYTATLTGVTIPDDAVMLTGGVGYTYGSGSPPLTQMNLPDYPATVSAVDPTTFTGGLAVAAPNVWKVATGYTGRRPIVDTAKCNKCHEALGVFTLDAFHSGQRNDAQSCSWCHTPNRTSQGWALDSTYFVHGIHGADKRTVKFTWDAESATDGFFSIGYPGILKNCETCHLPGTYDFSASASASALPNRLFRTAGTGTYSSAASNAFTFSPYVTQDAATLGSGFSFAPATGVTTPAAGTTLVISPIMTACVSCHDGVGTSGVDATVHMQQNGGAFYKARSTLYNLATADPTDLQNTETCILCHGSGGIADIKTMHAK